MTEQTNPFHPDWRRIRIRCAVLVVFSAILLGLTSAVGSVGLASDGAVLRLSGRVFYKIHWLSIASVVLPLAALILPSSRRALRALSRTQGFRFLPGSVFLAALCTGPLRYPGSWTMLACALAGGGALLFLLRRETGRTVDWIVCGRRADWPFVTLLAVCVAMGTYGLYHVLFGGEPYFVDTWARLFHAYILDRGQWFLPAPRHPEFYVAMRIVLKDGRWYSQYFPGAILLLWAGLRIGSHILIPSLMAAGVVAFTYLCGRKLYSRGTGLLAAFLVAVSPYFLFHAALVAEHTATMFFLMAALWSGLKDVEKPSFLHAALFGLALGYAGITRPLTALGFSLVLSVAYFALTGSQWRRRWPFWLTGFAVWCVPTAFLFYFNFRTTGHPLTPGYAVQGATYHSLGFTPRNAHTPLAGLFNEIEDFNGLSQLLFMWPVSSYLPVLFLFVAGRAGAKDLLLLSPFAGLLAAYFFYPYHDLCFGPRFVAEAIPPLALLSARGIAEALALAQRHGSPAASAAVRRALFGLIAALTIGAVLPTAQWYGNYGFPPPSGLSLTRRLREFPDDPLATVFFHYPGAENRGLVEQVRRWSGIEFFLAPSRESIRAYMAERPERHFYLLTGADYENTTRLGPAKPIPPIEFNPRAQEDEE